MVRMFLVIFLSLFLIIPLYGKNSDGDQLPSQRIKDKRPGWFFTGVPIIGGNNNDGLCMGAYLELTNNGKKDSLLWNKTHYLMKLSLSLIISLNGYHFYSLGFDMPRINNTRFSILARASFRHRDHAPFYGFGENARYLTSRPGTQYSTMADYKNIFLFGGGTAENIKYNTYKLTDPVGYIKMYFEPLHFLRFSLGAAVQYAVAESWKGLSFTYSDNIFIPVSGYTSNDTLFDTLGQSRIEGFYNRIYGGIALDFRDYRPDPQKGLLLSYVFEISGFWLGSAWNYHRHTVDLRAYYTFFKIMTIAGHMFFHYNSPNTPFFRMGYLGYFEEERYGLGNSRTLRGFHNGRFIGTIMYGASLEVRVQAVKFKIKKELITIKPLVFTDLARASESWSNIAADPLYLEAGYGLGTAITWNQSTVLHFYLGFSREDITVSFDIDHAF